MTKVFDCVHVWTKHWCKYHFVSFQVSKFVSVRANSNWFNTIVLLNTTALLCNWITQNANSYNSLVGNSALYQNAAKTFALTEYFVFNCHRVCNYIRLADLGEHSIFLNSKYQNSWFGIKMYSSTYVKVIRLIKLIERHLTLHMLDSIHIWILPSTSFGCM